MKNIILLFIFLFSITANSLTIIVNKSNPINSISISSLRNIYLMSVNNWINREKIQIIDYKTSNDNRKNFCKIYLNGLSPYRESKYWIKAALGGQNSPPLIMDSEQEAIDYVARNSAAIAYINSKNTKIEKVKILKIE